MHRIVQLIMRWQFNEFVRMTGQNEKSKMKRTHILQYAKEDSKFKMDMKRGSSYDKTVQFGYQNAALWADYSDNKFISPTLPSLYPLFNLLPLRH